MREYKLVAKLTSTLKKIKIFRNKFKQNLRTVPAKFIFSKLIQLTLKLKWVIDIIVIQRRPHSENFSKFAVARNTYEVDALYIYSFETIVSKGENINRQVQPFVSFEFGNWYSCMKKVCHNMIWKGLLLIFRVLSFYSLGCTPTWVKNQSSFNFLLVCYGYFNFQKILILRRNKYLEY